MMRSMSVGGNTEYLLERINEKGFGISCLCLLIRAAYVSG